MNSIIHHLLQLPVHRWRWAVCQRICCTCPPIHGVVCTSILLARQSTVSSARLSYLPANPRCRLHVYRTCPPIHGVVCTSILLARQSTLSGNVYIISVACRPVPRRSSHHGVSRRIILTMPTPRTAQVQRASSVLQRGALAATVPRLLPSRKQTIRHWWWSGHRRRLVRRAAGSELIVIVLVWIPDTAVAIDDAQWWWWRQCF